MARSAAGAARTDSVTGAGWGPAADPAAIGLRAVGLGDVERLREWRNRPAVARYMFTDHEIGEAEHAAWFGRAMNDPTQRLWIIELHGEPVGFAGLSEISTRHRRATWGFYLADEDVRGKGVGSAVWRLLMSVVFEELDLDKLCSEVLATNDRVVEMHRRHGFHVDGILRGHIRKGGRPVDVVTLSLFRDEWRARRHEDPA